MPRSSCRFNSAPIPRWASLFGGGHHQIFSTGIVSRGPRLPGYQHPMLQDCGEEVTDAYPRPLQIAGLRQNVQSLSSVYSGQVLLTSHSPILLRVGHVGEQRLGEEAKSSVGERPRRHLDSILVANHDVPMSVLET